MSESVKVTLEVYAAPTFSLSAPRRYAPGVVGDDVAFTVTMSAVGNFSSDVVLECVGAPAGAVVTYSPVDATIAPGETLTVTIDTDACDAGVTTLTVQEAT